MIASKALLDDLKKQLKLLQADLTSRSTEPDLIWAKELRAEYDTAVARERTARSWVDWRDGQIDQAAVAWLISSTFVRFCEDNHLLDGARDARGLPAVTLWLAGPGERTKRAVENQTSFYHDHTTANARDWLQAAFGVLANEPAGRALVDPRHNPVWSAPISAEAAKSLVDFWRATDATGELAHDFTDATLDTRFLGDLYQDLSEHAKKTYALLQTPVFVEEFILDQTLTPAIEEFGLTGLKLIDPTCGSGHFLLGAFERLNEEWKTKAPQMPARERVRTAMDSIHGVDLNPFAAAIARFRLTVAGLLSAGDTSLVGVAPMGFHVAVGDSLLGGEEQEQGFDLSSAADDTVAHQYGEEDLTEHSGILNSGTYHVVVGNPPYIQVKDKALNERYRRRFLSCSGKYALSVPFMELFFQLARRENSAAGAGYVGKITSNSFMKREFGKKLIEVFLAGKDLSSTRNNPVDLLKIIDTSGAYIPGHGTPTVILVGRPRRPSSPSVRAALGIRGEPGQPRDASQGLVWREIVENISEAPSHNSFVTISDIDRKAFSTFPWSLSGGESSRLKLAIDTSGSTTLAAVSDSLGITSFTLEDDVYVRPARTLVRQGVSETRPMVLGDTLRDWSRVGDDVALFPYNEDLEPSFNADGGPLHRAFWPFRTNLSNNVMFGAKTKEESGLHWTEFGRLTVSKLRTPLAITFAFVATHNHFVLDRGGKVFKQSAPVIKLPAGASEDDHLELLATLNSSTACFWLKQVSHNKGRPGAESAGADEPWEHRFEFTGTKLQDFPLPKEPPIELARDLDRLAHQCTSLSPRRAIDEHFLGLSTRSENDERSSLSSRLERAGEEYLIARRLMVFAQEELDWHTYHAYGLCDRDLTYEGNSVETAPAERAFAISMARDTAAGSLQTTWFAHHNHRFAPVYEPPSTWPADYADLVQRRLAVIESNPFINLLERPENKRRWASTGWDAQVKEAAQAAVLDLLEAPELWRDEQGPVTRSVAQLADLVRHNSILHELLEVLAGSTTVDLVPALATLIADDSVPHIAALRYKEPGVEKFREWQAVWDLQRAEDRGETVTIPVPPKYKPVDFRNVAVWRARGKLDVPKERFISYPGAAASAGDSTPVLGWAGWNHADQALALARLVGRQNELGAESEALIPLLAGLFELEPWLHQWHNEVDPAYGVSPAQAISGLLDGELARLSVTRNDLNAWRPAATTRGRRAKAAPAPSTLDIQELTS